MECNNFTTAPAAELEDTEDIFATQAVNNWNQTFENLSPEGAENSPRY